MRWGLRLARIAFSCSALAAGTADAQTAAPSPPPAEASRAEAKTAEARATEARFQKMLFGIEAPKSRSRACFTRVYDAAHLKAHPNQHVVDIRVSAHYDPVERMLPDSDTPREKWGYALRRRLRSGKVKTFKDEGFCSFRGRSSDGASFIVLCNPACESGDYFWVDADGKSAKLTTKDDLVHPEYTWPDATAAQAAKADDGVFRLLRVKDSLCDFDKP